MYNIKKLQELDIDLDMVQELKRIQHIFLKNNLYISLLDCKSLWVDISKECIDIDENCDNIPWISTKVTAYELSSIIKQYIDENNLLPVTN